MADWIYSMLTGSTSSLDTLDLDDENDNQSGKMKTTSPELDLCLKTIRSDIEKKTKSLYKKVNNEDSDSWAKTLLKLTDAYTYADNVSASLQKESEWFATVLPQIQFYLDLLKVKTDLAKQLHDLSQQWNSLDDDEADQVVTEVQKLFKVTEKVFGDCWNDILALRRRVSGLRVTEGPVMNGVHDGDEEYRPPLDTDAAESIKKLEAAMIEHHQQILTVGGSILDEMRTYGQELARTEGDDAILIQVKLTDRQIQEQRDINKKWTAASSLPIQADIQRKTKTGHTCTQTEPVKQSPVETQTESWPRHNATQTDKNTSSERETQTLVEYDLSCSKCKDSDCEDVGVQTEYVRECDSISAPPTASNESDIKSIATSDSSEEVLVQVRRAKENNQPPSDPSTPCAHTSVSNLPDDRSETPHTRERRKSEKEFQSLLSGFESPDSDTNNYNTSESESENEEEEDNLKFPVSLPLIQKVLDEDQESQDSDKVTVIHIDPIHTVPNSFESCTEEAIQPEDLEVESYLSNSVDNNDIVDSDEDRVSVGEVMDTANLSAKRGTKAWKPGQQQAEGPSTPKHKCAGKEIKKPTNGHTSPSRGGKTSPGGKLSPARSSPGSGKSSPSGKASPASSSGKSSPSSAGKASPVGRGASPSRGGASPSRGGKTSPGGRASPGKVPNGTVASRAKAFDAPRKNSGGRDNVPNLSLQVGSKTLKTFHVAVPGSEKAGVAGPSRPSKENVDKKPNLAPKPKVAKPEVTKPEPEPETKEPEEKVEQVVPSEQEPVDETPRRGSVVNMIKKFEQPSQDGSKPVKPPLVRRSSKTDSPSPVEAAKSPLPKSPSVEAMKTKSPVANVKASSPLTISSSAPEETVKIKPSPVKHTATPAKVEVPPQKPNEKIEPAKSNTTESHPEVIIIEKTPVIASAKPDTKIQMNGDAEHKEPSKFTKQNPEATVTANKEPVKVTQQMSEPKAAADKEPVKVTKQIPETTVTVHKTVISETKVIDAPTVPVPADVPMETESLDMVDEAPTKSLHIIESPRKSAWTEKSRTVVTETINLRVEKDEMVQNPVSISSLHRSTVIGPAMSTDTSGTTTTDITKELTVDTRLANRQVSDPGKSVTSPLSQPTSPSVMSPRYMSRIGNLTRRSISSVKSTDSEPEKQEPESPLSSFRAGITPTSPGASTSSSASSPFSILDDDIIPQRKSPEPTADGNQSDSSDSTISGHSQKAPSSLDEDLSDLRKVLTEATNTENKENDIPAWKKRFSDKKILPTRQRLVQQPSVLIQQQFADIKFEETSYAKEFEFLGARKKVNASKIFSAPVSPAGSVRTDWDVENDFDDGASFYSCMPSMGGSVTGSVTRRRNANVLSRRRKMVDLPDRDELSGGSEMRQRFGFRPTMGSRRTLRPRFNSVTAIPEDKAATDFKSQQRPKPGLQRSNSLRSASSLSNLNKNEEKEEEPEPVVISPEQIEEFQNKYNIKSVYDSIGLAMSLENAIKRGIINVMTAQYVNPFLNKGQKIESAISNGLITVLSPVERMERMRAKSGSAIEQFRARRAMSTSSLRPSNTIEEKEEPVMQTQEEPALPSTNANSRFSTDLDNYSQRMFLRRTQSVDSSASAARAAARAAERTKRRGGPSSNYGMIVFNVDRIPEPFHVSDIRDTKTNAVHTYDTAVRFGLLERDGNVYVDKKTQRRMPIEEAQMLGHVRLAPNTQVRCQSEGTVTDHFLVYGVMDTQNQRRLTFQQAVESHILKPGLETFRNMAMNQEIPIDEAIEGGFIIAKKITAESLRLYDGMVADSSRISCNRVQHFSKHVPLPKPTSVNIGRRPMNDDLGLD